jgi:glucose-6-phosphate 1-dehydrogenase
MGKLPQHFLIMGVGLNLWSNKEYREKILFQMLERGFVEPDDWGEFATHLEWHYLNIDENDLTGYQELKERLVQFDGLYGNSKWIYYCSIPPQFFYSVIEYLYQAKMLEHPEKQVVALEKPFAKSQKEAEKLWAVIQELCHPQQVVCVEHFNFKPMSIFMKDFIENNSVIDFFEPQHLQSIEILASESIGVPVDRVGFFDACPALMDMHSHLLIPMLSQFVSAISNRQ